MESRSLTTAALVTPRSERTGAIAWIVSDKWFVGLTIAFVLIATSLPYFYGYLSAPAGKQFMGIMLDVPDHTQYFSWMRELSHANLASNKMTSEANRPVFFNLLWWGLGRLSVLLGVGYAVMFQILRVGVIIMFLLLAYWMCYWFLKEQRMARLAFLLITFTSGFGWVLVALKYINRGNMPLPLDVYIAEGNTFLDMLGYPHFIAALLYVFIFILVLQGQAKMQLRYAVAAGLLGLFLGWQHTYDLVSVYGVLAAFTLLLVLRDRRIPWYMVKSCIIIGLLSCSAAIYSVLLTSLDPTWKGVLSQFSNAGVFTPNPFQLFILFGPLFIAAIFTVIREARQKLSSMDDKELFLKGWFLSTFLIIYIPVNYQIHLLNGWQVPMAILATTGIFKYMIPWVEKQFAPILKNNPTITQPGANLVSRLVVLAAILVVVPTNLYLWTWRFTDLGKHDYPYYLSNGEISGMDWLNTHASPDDVVLSSLTLGQYIPAMTGTHAYLAHWAQTLDYFTKTKNVANFFAANSTVDQREELLAAGNVRYVFYGPAEREVGQASPAGLPGVIMVYSSTPSSPDQSVIIFQFHQK